MIIEYEIQDDKMAVDVGRRLYLSTISRKFLKTVKYDLDLCTMQTKRVLFGKFVPSKTLASKREYLATVYKAVSYTHLDVYKRQAYVCFHRYM